LILTECDSCAEGRATGAAFCEACGRRLTETAAVGSADESDADSLSAGGPAAGEAAGASRTGKSTGLAGRDCPHCGAEAAVAADGYCDQCGMLAGRPRDHTEADGDMMAAAVSDRGRRHHRNEDAMWLAVGTDAVDVVVCDGVSSSFDPDVASEVAAKAAGELLARAQHPAQPAKPAGDEPGGEPAAGEVATAEAGADEPDDEPTVPAEPGHADEGEPALSIADVVGRAIQGAGEMVAALAGTGDPRRAASNPACTIVAAAVRGPHVGFGWVGDSRIYWVSDSGPAEQLSEDDSWARHVIAMGADPRVAMNDPKAHAITAWLGADAGRITPRVGAFTAGAPGHLVLCSDGLWNYLTDPEDFGDAVRSALRVATGSRPLLEAARALVAYANSAGGADNITVAIVPVPPQIVAEAEGDGETVQAEDSRTDNEPSEA
jgi:serine/threonine protein phosphatase PrpC